MRLGSHCSRYISHHNPASRPRCYDLQIMLDASGVLLRLASAVAIGLLIGAERERRKGDGPNRSPAGIRTFAMASLVGATSVLLGSDWLLAASVFGVAALSTVAYWRSHLEDPGLT